jgi:hypothetical protein
MYVCIFGSLSDPTSVLRTRNRHVSGISTFNRTTNHIVHCTGSVYLDYVSPCTIIIIIICLYRTCAGSSTTTVFYRWPGDIMLRYYHTAVYVNNDDLSRRLIRGGFAFARTNHNKRKYGCVAVLTMLITIIIIIVVIRSRARQYNILLFFSTAWQNAFEQRTYILLLYYFIS